MMELSDSTQERPEPARSVLCIDLNEVPSYSSSGTPSPDAFAVVRAFHGNLPLPDGAPARIPGDSDGSACAACGVPEVLGPVVVCDGCERGFHLSCAGMQGCQAVTPDEWICEYCAGSGVLSTRWPLGSKSMLASNRRRDGVPVLDINASPPSDAEGERIEELTDLRNHTPGDNSFGGNSFGTPVTYSRLFAENGFGFQEASGIGRRSGKLSFEELLLHIQTVGRSTEELDMRSHTGRTSGDHSVLRTPPQSTSRMYLQALREFITENQGVLGEGWHVEMTTSMASGELHAVYCAPDGKTFDSMPEVACYLGLTPGSKSIEPEVRSNESTQRRPQLAKRRKSARRPMVAENKEKLTFNVVEAGPEENNVTGPQRLNDGLPVRYEDFFIFSLGKVDIRPSYHDVHRIWPVGYKSCWHDMITGSLFMCDVLDGGPSGPKFRVRRYSCSSLPIPDASTVIFRPHVGQSGCESKTENDKLISLDMDYDEDFSVQMMLSDPSPPRELDILSCLGSGFSDSYNVLASNNLLLQTTGLCDGYGNAISDESFLSSEIGDFFVEEFSSSSAWRMVSKKLLDSCREIYMKRGALKFFCKHVENGTCTSYDINEEKIRETYSSLTKFCGSSPSVRIPSLVRSDSMLEAVFEELVKWLDQDRFGLDVPFVLEFLEKLPNVHACSNYIFLSERDYCSSSPMVGNGLLLVKTEGNIQSREEGIQDGLLRCPERDRPGSEKNHPVDNCQPPPGKPVSLKLPPQLVGDVLQVCECLWRFSEILGLREAFSFEELEEELLSPWSDGLDLLNTAKGEYCRTQEMTSSRTDCTSEHILSWSAESHLEVPMDHPLEFMQLETGAMKEADQARMASLSYSRCTGLTLTKAHNALLQVLISELQLKVAAVIDPNIDTGEPRSKRGRKRDIDCSTSARKTKFKLLPVNEFTWPELARRYILAVLSMGGNLDSPEITIRESGKVFRCLQGDGGVLCGSLTGVVGMEADAMFLAEALRKMFSAIKIGNDVLTVDDEEDGATSAHDRITVDDGSNIPEWTLLLEPVRKLPTNVGARIRNCINEALAKGPPEWAKERLLHSISREVYKGNASGPTKKAVLLVLEDAKAEGLQKPEERKRKKYISVSDMIMKQCRIVLRRIASADDEKVFCNLVGRKLIHSTDNDDEGILGSPAMASRVLDFRTIDLRLAAGAYGGSHESFFEDVQELWTNIRIAYADQPDIIQLAEKLSSDFEAMYEKEVHGPFSRFSEYAKSEYLSAELMKEITDFLLSLSELPKAPWEDGVCKVCGIDKDDTSVLLCDKCDGEYHKYCLNPPLARIPEGDWYCPSCVAGKSVVQDVLECDSQLEEVKKYQGEITRIYFHSLTNLAAVMVEKEYWELTVDKRTLLLKFLCDELLNSALTHQHLEHCSDVSADMQQKLRSLSVEWRNLKQKEEVLAAKIVTDTGFHIAVRNGLEEEPAAQLNTRCFGPVHTLNDRPDSVSVLSDGSTQLAGGQNGPAPISTDKSLFLNNTTKRNCADSGTTESLGLEDQSEDVHIVLDDNRAPGNFSTLMTSTEETKRVGSQLDIVRTNVAKYVSPAVLKDFEATNLELNSVRNEISVVQESVNRMETELVKLSLRKEFLGSDSAGRLYWLLAKPGACSQVNISSSAAMQQGKNMLSGVPKEKYLLLRNSSPFGLETVLTCGFAGASYQCMQVSNDASFSCSPWIFYESEAEIKELIKCLKDNDPTERVLKESILQWQTSRFQNSARTGNSDQDKSSMAILKSTKSENTLSSRGPVTRAFSLLENTFGPCFEPETLEASKRRGKKAKVTTAAKMYRCKCLELVWPSRYHCLSCHKTFCNDMEFQGHDDAKCNLGPAVSEMSKENGALKGKRMITSETVQSPSQGEMDASKSISESSELNSMLIKYQNDGLICPFDFGDICSKFKTATSNKELVQGIGLIGSDGVPSFVPSISPYLSDYTEMLIPSQRDAAITGDGHKSGADSIVSQGNKMTSNTGPDNVSPRTYTAKTDSGALRNEGLKIEDKGLSLSDRAPVKEVAACCIVPENSLRPVVGKAFVIFRQLKIDLLDMDAALPDAALRPSRAHLERRWAWRAFLKSAETIHEMVQAVVVLEDMIKTKYLDNMWWYWSSLSAAAKISTLSSLALRIYSLDAAIDYQSNSFNSDSLPTCIKPDQNFLSGPDATEKSRSSRKPNKKRKEMDT